MTIVVIICSAFAFVLGIVVSAIYGLTKLADAICEADDYMDCEIEVIKEDDNDNR